MYTPKLKQLALKAILTGPLYHKAAILLDIMGKARIKQKECTIGVLSEILEENQGIGGASLYQVAILYQAGKIRF